MSRSPRSRSVVTTFLLSLLLVACEESGSTGPEPPGPPPAAPDTVAPVVLSSYPHDSTAFTQGLLFDNGILLESTGRRGFSTVRRVDPQTGAIQSQRALADRYFAEGLTLHNGELVQLTWTSGKAFRYDPATLALLDSFSYGGQGWGLTSDGTRFIMSDGSSTITFRDDAFQPIGSIAVTLDGNPVRNLNELEYARGRIYANVWFRDSIVEIDPADGRVTRVIDCSALVAAEQPRAGEAVLNGIAWRADTETFYLTGKWWRTVFAVQIPTDSTASTMATMMLRSGAERSDTIWRAELPSSTTRTVSPAPAPTASMAIR